MKVKISLWSGAGYFLNEENVIECNDLEDGLIKASITDNKCLFIDDSSEFDNLEDADNYMYLDRSAYGLSNGYLCIENARIEELRF